MSRRGRRGPEPSFDSPPGPVLLRIVFERFPVTIKGAFVLRGGDPNPHVARIIGAELARTPSGAARPIAVEGAPMDVAPRLDLFLPFEAVIAELDPGWYVVRCELQVDGARPTSIESRPFSVAWSRGTTTTGTASPSARASFGGRSLVIDRVDLRGDRVEVLWRTENWTGGDPDLALSADGKDLEPLPSRAGGAAEPGSGRHRSVWYPAPRGTKALAVQASTRSSGKQRLVIPLT